MAPDGTPGSVEALYQQLACERAGRARASLAREASVERLFAESAAALEDAAGALLHAATAFIAIEGPLPGLFAEQAGALLAVAARFEEAADLSRSGDRRNGGGEATP
jgi:predicted NBD/HSP70 family sugar kinase